VIVFINGSFGVGKSTLAELLVKAVPNSLMFDPEEVGYYLRNILGGSEPVDDFQDYPLWRELVVQSAKGLLRDYKRPLIMPMTVWREEYFHEIIGGLKQFEPELHVFCLIASADVIYERLSQRGGQEGDWNWARVERCCEAFESGRFGEPIDMGTVAPDAVARIILEKVA
jgi:AAA domain